MKVSELADAPRGSNPEAEVVTCLEVPDGEGDCLLFSECPPSLAGPYPGDDGGFLAHASLTPGELASQACDPSVMRGLARALEREADSMEPDGAGNDEGCDSL